MSLKEKKAELATKHFFRALTDMAAKLEAAGWLEKRASEENLLAFRFSDKALIWAGFAAQGQLRAIEAGKTVLRNPAFLVARLSLLLELVALDCPPSIIGTIFDGGEEVTWWAAWSLVNAARGRHYPAWWRKEEGWLQSLAGKWGDTWTVVQDAHVAWEGMAAIAQRLAERGWFDLTIARNGKDAILKCDWPKDFEDTIIDLLAPSTVNPIALLIPDLVVVATIGRLALLLELRCWGAHGATASKIMASSTPLDLWVARLAELFHLGQWRPRWWNASFGWHEAFRHTIRELREHAKQKGGHQHAQG